MEFSLKDIIITILSFGLMTSIIFLIILYFREPSMEECIKRLGNT